jgi:hypothetical protein
MEEIDIREPKEIDRIRWSDQNYLSLNDENSGFIDMFFGGFEQPSNKESYFIIDKGHIDLLIEALKKAKEIWR